MPVTSSREAVEIFRKNDTPKNTDQDGQGRFPRRGGHILAPALSERRNQARSPFTAAITILEPLSGARIEAHTTDLCVGGCYVDTMNPFPIGTSVRARLQKDGKILETDARVACCQIGMGMGLAFTEVEAEKRRILDRWFAEVRGESTPEPHSLEQKEQVPLGRSLREKEHCALEELLVLLLRKGVLTEEEGEPILKRLLS